MSLPFKSKLCSNLSEAWCILPARLPVKGMLQGLSQPLTSRGTSFGSGCLPQIIQMWLLWGWSCSFASLQSFPQGALL